MVAGGSPFVHTLRVRYAEVDGQKIVYNAHYLSQRLHGLGWSAQEPGVSPQERSEMLVEAWLKGDWPRIKKRLSNRSADRLCG